MRASGKVGLVGLIMIAALVAGAYWLILFGPGLIDNIEVKEKVAIAFNLRGQRSAEQIHDSLLSDVNLLSFGTHDVFDPMTNETKKVPGLGLAPEQVVVEEDIVRKFVRVEVSYERTLVMWPSKKVKVQKFKIEKSGTY